MTAPKPKRPRSPKPSANGAAPKPRKPARPRKPRVKPPPKEQRISHPALPEPPPPPPRVEPTIPLSYGRVASSIHKREVTWLLDGLIPKGALTFLIGDKDTGKSTMGSWLMAQASRPALLPGFEEDFSSHTEPRLVAHGVDLEKLLILDTRQWQLPGDRLQLAKALEMWGCDLLWVDPIDSYVSESAEIGAPAAREALESLAHVASVLNLAVVCVRHPGKSRGNLSRGSVAWGAVPRVIIELRLDKGPPERRYLRLARDAYNTGTKPQEYTLTGEKRQPKIFALAGVAKEEDVDYTNDSDPQHHWKVEEAMDALADMLEDGPKDGVWCFAECEKERLMPSTVRDARRRLGIVVSREGSGKSHKSVWTITPESLLQLRQRQRERGFCRSATPTDSPQP